jgi:hypothetical protein
MTTHTDARYPAVSISNRLFNILGVDPIELDDLDEFSYSWSGGYEVLTANREGGGTLEYRGVYHPGNGQCEGNPCSYCGMTFHD